MANLAVGPHHAELDAAHVVVRRDEEGTGTLQCPVEVFGNHEFAQALAQKFRDRRTEKFGGGRAHKRQAAVHVDRVDRIRERIDQRLVFRARAFDLQFVLLERRHVGAQAYCAATQRRFVRPFDPAAVGGAAHVRVTFATEARDRVLGRHGRGNTTSLVAALRYTRPLRIGTADRAGVQQSRRDRRGGLVEHDQPLVPVVEHDAGGQRVERLLHDLGGGPRALPLGVMQHRGPSDEEDQHQARSGEADRAERQHGQGSRIIVRHAVDQRVVVARGGNACLVDPARQHQRLGQHLAVDLAAGWIERGDLGVEAAAQRRAVGTDAEERIEIGRVPVEAVADHRQGGADVGPGPAHRKIDALRCAAARSARVEAAHQFAIALVELEDFRRLAPVERHLGGLERRGDIDERRHDAEKADRDCHRREEHAAPAHRQANLGRERPQRRRPPARLRADNVGFDAVGKRRHLIRSPR